MIRKIQQLPTILILSLLTILIAFGIIGYGVMDLLTPEHPLVGCWETSVGPIGFRKDGHFVTTVLSSSGEWRVVDENRIEVIPRWGRLWGVEGPMNFSLIEDSTTKFQLLSKELRILIYRSYSDPQNCQEPWQLP